MSGWLNVLGLVLQVVGALVAVAGLRQTWRAYDDWGFAAAMLAPVATSRPALQLRRLLGWHQSVVVQAGVAEVRATAVGASVQVSWQVLPADHDLALAELDRRTRLTEAAVAQVTARQAADVADLQRGLAGLGAGVAAEAAARATAVRTVAVGGVLWAARGLLLVAVGLVLQLVAAVVAPGA